MKLVFEFISAGIGAVLLAIGILAFIFPKVKGVIKILPVFNWQIWAVLFIGVGLLTGGIGVYQGYLGTAMAVTGVAVSEVPPVSEDIGISHCVYSAGTSFTGNITVRQDTTANNVVYLDVDASEWDTGNHNTAGDINVNFTCYREGATSEDGASLMIVKGEEFRSETSTSDTNTYNVLETSTRQSQIISGQGYTQTIYLADNEQASTSSTKEFEYLTFGEGEKALTLSLYGEIDETNFGYLNDYTMKDVTVYNRLNGADKVVARIVINKLP